MHHLVVLLSKWSVITKCLQSKVSGPVCGVDTRGMFTRHKHDETRHDATQRDLPALTASSVDRTQS